MKRLSRRALDDIALEHSRAESAMSWEDFKQGRPSVAAVERWRAAREAAHMAYGYCALDPARKALEAMAARAYSGEIAPLGRRGAIMTVTAGRLAIAA